MKSITIILTLVTISAVCPRLVEYAPAVNDDTIPLFLGINITDMSRRFIEELSTRALQSVQLKFPSPVIAGDIEEILNQEEESEAWAYPLQPHITQLFLGNQMPTQPTQKAFYENYRSGVTCPITIPAIAYIPNGLITAIDYIDREVFYVERQFPHTTLLSSELTPVYSNNMLEALGLIPEFAADYSSRFKNAAIKRYEITIEDRRYSAFVVPIKELHTFGFTNQFYTA